MYDRLYITMSTTDSNKLEQNKKGEKAGENMKNNL